MHSIAVLRPPQQRLARWAAVVSIVMLVVAVAGLAIQAVTVTGFGNHQVRWLFALSVIVHVTILWGVSRVGGGRWPDGRRRRRWLDVGDPSSCSRC